MLIRGDFGCFGDFLVFSVIFVVHILLLESPCPFVRPSVRKFAVSYIVNLTIYCGKFPDQCVYDAIIIKMHRIKTYDAPVKNWGPWGPLNF